MLHPEGQTKAAIWVYEVDAGRQHSVGIDVRRDLPGGSSHIVTLSTIPRELYVVDSRREFPIELVPREITQS
jgi:hypothetical protein